ncbi:MAG: papain-like cysteine protease family protein [Candidatus Ozemobacteraceae bacterium]
MNFAGCNDLKIFHALLYGVLGLFFLVTSVWSVGAVEPAKEPFSPEFTVKGDLTQLRMAGIQQTTDFTCGPCAILSLLDYYKMSGNEFAIASQAHCGPASGTNPRDMTEWLEKNGFEARWAEAPGYEEGLKILRKNLEKGIPTIVEWIDWGGHWVVCIGYDTKSTPTTSDDEIIFADPYDRTDGKIDGISRFNAERFGCMWFDAHCFDRPMKCVYIQAFPKRLQNP